MKRFHAVGNRLVRTRGARASYGGSSNVTDPAAWVFDAFKVRPTASGETVTVESALTVPRLYSAVRNLSEDIGGLPVHWYRKHARGRELLVDFPLEWMWNVEWNSQQGAEGCRSAMVAHAILRGGGFAEITRNGAGEPVAMTLYHPSWVQIKRDANGMFYRVAVPRENGTQEIRIVKPLDMFHLHGLGDDGITGYPIVALMAEAIGEAQAMQSFRAALFGNDTALGAVFTHPATMGDTARKNFKESLEAYRGARKAGKSIVLEDGMKVDRMGIAPEQAQMVEAGLFKVGDLASLLRMPLHMIQELSRSTNNNIEHQGIEYVVYALGPHAKRIEQEARRKLLSDRTFYMRHNFDALLRGDYRTRAEGTARLLGAGLITINEGRELEERNHVEDEGADKLWMQGAMRPVDSLATARAETSPPPASPPEREAEMPMEGEPAKEMPEEKDSAAISAASLAPLFLQAAERIAAREANHVANLGGGHRESPAAFAAWARDFYADLARRIANEFAPSFAVCRGDLARLDAEARTAAADARDGAVRLFATGKLAETLKESVDAAASRLAARLAAVAEENGHARIL